MAMPIKAHDKKTASYLAKAVPTVCFGVLVISNSTNAIRIDLWDSDDAASTGDTWLGAVSIGASPGAGSLTQGLFFGPNGVHCSKGLWAELTGTGEFTVYME